MNQISSQPLLSASPKISASVKVFSFISRKRIISFLGNLKSDVIYQVFNINRYDAQDTFPTSLPAAEAAICTILLAVPELVTSRNQSVLYHFIKQFDDLPIWHLQLNISLPTRCTMPGCVLLHLVSLSGVIET